MKHPGNMISVLLCLVLNYAGTDGYMDNKCPCLVDEIHHVANCTFLNLTTVPECIPNDTIMLLLTGNKIHSLDTGIFERLNSLKSLFLDSNSLDHLRKGVFSNLSHLQILSLAHNELMFNESYPDNIFEPLINLKQLYIEGNCGSKPNTCSYPDKALSLLSTLEYLYLDGLPNKPLGEGFSKLVKLNTLKMDGLVGTCSLHHITTETFKNIQSLPVTDIELSVCSIRSILPNTFKGITRLRNLTMSFIFSPHDTDICGGITNVTIGLNTTDIKMLKLKDWSCYDMEVNMNTFKGIYNTTLEILDFSGQIKTNLHARSVYSLPRTLKYISFRNNAIDYLGNDFFHSLYTLGELEVFDLGCQIFCDSFLNSDKNMLTYMSHLDRGRKSKVKGNIYKTDKTSPKLDYTNVQLEHFPLPPKLRMFYANNVYKTTLPVLYNVPLKFTPNSLQHFDLSNCILTEFPGPWYGLHDLQFLDFSGNYFRMIKPSAFSDMKNLTTLLLQNNRIGENIMQDTKGQLFLYQKKLIHLDLGDNSIKNIPINMFQSQQNLQMLSLANNALSSINFTLNNTISLEFLNISSNMLTSLSEQNTAELDQITKTSNLTVDLTGNRLHCNCENIEFVNWFRKTNVQFFNKQHLICKFENGTMIKSLRMDDIYEELTYICNIWLVLILSTITFVTLLLILSLIAVMCDRSWELKYWYYIGRRIVNPYHALDRDTVQLVDHVYISYDPCYDIFPDLSLDYYVKQTVLPRLKKRGLIVKIREDLQPGRGMCDVISETLRGSRKVIAFVSEDYCSDYWNTFEFNMAVHEGMYTKRDVVIPIKFGDDLDQSLNQEIALFLKSDHYPTFTGNRNNIGQLLEYLEDKIRQ